MPNFLGLFKAYTAKAQSPRRPRAELYKEQWAELTELLRDMKHRASDDSPRSGGNARGISFGSIERARELMGKLECLLVQEAREGPQDEEHDALPPCHEHMLRHEVFIELREAIAFIPVLDVQILLLHHLSDLILFVLKPLGHYKQVIEPVLELLRQLEDLVQLWAPPEQAQDGHSTQAALSHACIQLVYALAWQLTHTGHCAAFFFVDRRDLTFAEEQQHAHGDEIFILFEFAIPYLRRREHILAGDVAITHRELKGQDAQRLLHTSDVAIDTLICILSLPAARVVRYLEQKGALFGRLVAENVEGVCLKLLNDEGSLPTPQERWAQNAERLQQRLRLLQAVGAHQSEKLRQLVSAEYTQLVLKKVATLLYSRSEQSRISAVRLATVLIRQVPAAVLNAPLVELLVGGERAAELGGPQMLGVSRSLRQEIIGRDEELSAAVVELYSALLRARPLRTAERLIFPAFADLKPPCDAAPPLGSEMGSMFHPELRAGFHGPEAERLQQRALLDAMAGQLQMRRAVGRDSGTGLQSTALKLSDSTRAGDVPASPAFPSEGSMSMSMSGSRRRGSIRREFDLPHLVFSRIMGFFDHPLTLQVALIDIVTAMIQLWCDELTWYLLTALSDTTVTLKLVLQQLYKFVAAKREAMSPEDFHQQLAAARCTLGIPHPTAAAAAARLRDARTPPPASAEEVVARREEERFFCGAAVLEEWRIELNAVLTAQHRTALVAGMEARPETAPGAAQPGGIPRTDSLHGRAAGPARQQPPPRRPAATPGAKELHAPPAARPRRQTGSRQAPLAT